MKKEKRNVVYSTDPNFKFEYESEGDQETPPKNQQQLRIFPDRKNRAGKTVTIVSGFVGKTEDLKSLEKSLKGICGSGGTVKEGEIIIQGNFIAKIAAFLEKEGYKYKVSGI